MYRILQVPENLKITGLYTAFRHTFGPDFRFRGEVHDFWELVCVIDGEINVAADNKIFYLTKGQAILHSPMQFHNITAVGGATSTIGVFSFSGENIPNLQDQIFEIRDISVVKNLLELAKKHYHIRRGFSIRAPKSSDISHLIYVKRLELFLLELAENLTHLEVTHSRSARNYSLITETINDNIDKRLSVGELAVLCNMSAINLQKTFSKYSGVGVMEYFNRAKMRKADMLLKEGLSVKETALSLGFNDQNYFSTVFKRIMGRTPTHNGIRTKK